jgi:hypothetical protein
MVDASTSFVSTFPDENSARRTEIFLWSMLAIAVLDIILMLWVFQPWAGPDNEVRLTRVQSVQRSVVAEKPSPLGAVAPHRRAQKQLSGRP